jgi:hypothetical protein
MELATGRAEWIWSRASFREPRPLRVYATRDFALPSAPIRALAKVFVDREHVLYVNGRRAGSGAQQPGDPLAAYDVTGLLVAGANRVAIEAASPTGVGGILFSLDLDAYGRDAIVSDGDWRVDEMAAAVRDGAHGRPRVWGSPPQHPWGYPRMPRPEEMVWEAETREREPG